MEKEELITLSKNDFQEVLDSLNEMYTLATQFLLEKPCKESDYALALLVKHKQIIVQ